MNYAFIDSMGSLTYNNGLQDIKLYNKLIYYIL